MSGSSRFLHTEDPHEANSEARRIIRPPRDEPGLFGRAVSRRAPRRVEDDGQRKRHGLRAIRSIPRHLIYRQHFESAVLFPEAVKPIPFYDDVDGLVKPFLTL
jgi:hypothetical protein